MVNKNFYGSRINFINTIKRTDGMFVLCKSELIDNQEYIADNRCDDKKYGIIPLRRTPGVNYITESEDLLPVKDVKKVEVYQILYQENGVGVIAFIKFNDFELQEKFLQYEVAGISKTFFGLLKLMMEWRVMRNEPFNNNEEIAIISQNLLNSMQIPPSVLSEIWNTHPDMHVLRFIKGDTNSRSPEYPDMQAPYDFLKWIQDMFLPDNYAEVNGELVSLDDPRIYHVSVETIEDDDFFNRLI